MEFTAAAIATAVGWFLFLASDVIRHARNDCLPTSYTPIKDFGFQRSLCHKQAPHFCARAAAQIQSSIGIQQRHYRRIEACAEHRVPAVTIALTS